MTDRKNLFRALAVLLGCLVPLLLVWLLSSLQLFPQRRIRRGALKVAARIWVTPWRKILVFEPQLGWKAKPHLKVYCHADTPFRVRTDALGWRGKTSLKEARALAVGDSFAFGYGVGERDYFANRIPRFKALGIMGYNTAQQLLLIRRHLAHFRNKTTFLLVYHGNDLWDNLTPRTLGYTSPYVRPVGQGFALVTDHLSPSKEPKDAHLSRREYAEHLSRLCRDTAFARRAYAAFGFLLGAIKEELSKVGARLVVVGIPELLQLKGSPASAWRKALSGSSPKIRAQIKDIDGGYPDAQLAALSKSHGLLYVALRPMLRRKHYNKRDRHWSVEGNRLVAALLQRLLSPQSKPER